VIGGGPAGSSTAITLCRLGVPGVLLVEGRDYQTERIGECIPPDTRLLLEALGIWQEFLSEKHEPALGSCSSWGANELGHNDFLFNPHGHGWHLDRRRFDGFLARAAVNAGAELRLRSRCTGIERRAQEDFRISLRAPNGVHQVRARFLVDAGGSHSLLTRHLGSVRRVHDRLSYVAAFFERHDRPFSRLTWLEAVEYGWWYAAMLPFGRLVVGVAADAETIRDKALHQPVVFRACLDRTRHLSTQLVDCEPHPGPLQVRTAPSSALECPAGHDWLAVGDAAGACDPISSQGIYQALFDGGQAGAAIAARLAGETGSFEAYGLSRRGQFNEYLQLRNYLYDLEQRWPTAPFWECRRSRRDLKARRDAVQVALPS
jgi:flavin-dependent dehydrogenase